MRISVIPFLFLSLPSAFSTLTAWETAEQAARQARSLLKDPTVFGVGTLSTVYPDRHPDESLRGSIMSGPEYFAPCFPENGDLLFLGLTVSQNWRNVRQSDHHNATFSVGSNADPGVVDPRHSARTRVAFSSSPDHWDPHRPSWRKGMPSKGRVTLMGHFEELEEQAWQSAEKCFFSHHPDARHWGRPGPDSPHTPFWTRFVIDKVYWIGGFGDEHFIGWLSLERWVEAGNRIGIKAADGGSPNRHSATSTRIQQGEVGADVLFSENSWRESTSPNEAGSLLRFQRE
ncbi:hypothetical protein IE53DRAFT_386508 [Violaceomyces palustris]|uniref:Uncharacterized protein n=1 Tax=Violaceomyces palustris TaxID=1673888 RepID=A0ACD0NZI2_9BASI|nr:hypothetical protein IE53DRAFT_386508 [Violaceomyces palustris]